MKFVDIKKAKGFKVGDVVYTLDAEGKYGVGKLTSKSEDASGLVLKFEVPQYTSKDAPPSLQPVIVDNITHVAVMRDRKVGEEADGQGTVASAMGVEVEKPAQP